MKLDKTLSPKENIVNLLNTKSRVALTSGDISLGAPKDFVPVAPGAIENTALSVYILNSMYPGDTSVQYRRATLADVYFGEEGPSIDITRTTTKNQVLAEAEALLGVPAQTINFTDTLPYPNRTKIIQFKPVADHLVYRDVGFGITVRNTDPEARIVALNVAELEHGSQSITNIITGTAASVVSTAMASNVVQHNGRNTLSLIGTGKITLPGSDLGGIFTSEGDFTVEFWHYNTGVLGNYAPVSQLSNGAGYAWANQFYDNAMYAYYGKHSTTYISNFSNPYVLNAWQHYAYTKTGNTHRVFVNGVIKSTVVSPGGAQPGLVGAVLHLATNNLAGLGKWTGYMDMFEISNISKYTANFTPSVV